MPSYFGGAHNWAEANNTTAWNTINAGAAKDLHRFARWNIPHFAYSFDASFVSYFGPEGVNAVHEALGVINDFFENDEYSGIWTGRS